MHGQRQEREQQNDSRNQWGRAHSADRQQS